MQKKMGKALIRNIAEAREKEEKARKELEQAVEVKEEPSSSKPRKCVTFADVPPEDAQAEDGGEDHTTTTKDGLDWGDVAPARLRAHNHLSLVAKAQAEKSPMKMQVVERHPASLRGGEESTQDKDSDDESDIASSAPSSSSEPELEGDDDEVGDQDVLDDDFDWDSVRHQREVALEYYKKRLAIGADATQAMTSHTHDEDEWDQPEVPLDATLSSSRPKPAVSRFKADRIASSYNVSQPSASTSLGPSVIPASGQKSLQGAVRVGKLQNDQLVGGEAGESGSEDERVKEVLEMLKGGQIQNAGPDFVPPVKPSDANAPSEPSLQPQVDINPPVAAPTPSRASQKPSKFKLARKQHTVDPPSVPNTPISTVNRSSPRLPVSGVVERNAPRPRPREQYVSPQIVQPTGMTGGTLGGKPVMPSMVVDSPSFPAHHMVVDSPSFPGPTQLRRPDRPPAVMSTTVKEKAQGSTRQ
ncbi:hypothetical protein BV22DRAFT_1032666 [Leucogyrophana mollusca]|uniref:Uncharacterized protein n=1 Tax=Leucogyrophana mollusca TaxID=85980 RepID=A0ACB8BLA6_9AGAM|nr:hypothetical protein BV22DRAFT_1032666 [Leucogyrophana mollusca]